jgi:hypothetical protein|tara:strand:- start:1598 stop:2191 length:594 start_codon:yes stop_codon:yes gene_type:complete
MTGNTNTRNCNKTTTSALRPMERARGQDYAGAAECFVDAFFLKRNGGGDRITKSELAYLNGAQRKDLVSRYNQKNKGVMFVIKDADTNKVVGCVGAEVQKFVVNVPLRRAESDGELYVLHFPNPSDCLPTTVCPYIAMYKTDTFVVQSQSGDGTTGHREPCGGQRFPKTGNSQSADACHRGGVFGVGLHGNSSGGGG